VKRRKYQSQNKKNRIINWFKEQTYKLVHELKEDINKQLTDLKEKSNKQFREMKYLKETCTQMRKLDSTRKMQERITPLTK
jgi:hypothetical protein